MENIDQEIILTIMKRIELRLTNIEKDIFDLQKKNDKIIEHVAFVNEVYEKIKSPFYYIMNKVDDFLIKKKILNDINHDDDNKKCE